MVVNMEEREALKRQIDLLQSKSLPVNVDNCSCYRRVNKGCFAQHGCLKLVGRTRFVEG